LILSKIMFKQYSSSRNLLNAICICALLALTLSLLTHAQQTSNQPGDLKRAALLFDQRNYAAALSILEKLAITNPNDETIMYGLGVSLLMNASDLKDSKLRVQSFKQARAALLRAKGLGVNDYRLQEMLNALPPDGNGDMNSDLGRLVYMISTHPPNIFYTDPPNGIKLLEGYRNKSSTDFEGQTTGVIYRPNGLRIVYVIGAYEGEYAKAKEKDKYLWYREQVFNGRVFRCALAKDMMPLYQGETFIISTTLSKDSRFGLTANFYGHPKSREDVADMLLMVLGLTQ
jgi:hypothetical protein